eukprot:969441_1
MGAGHGGASGRYGRIKEISFEYAFLLDQLNMLDVENINLKVKVDDDKKDDEKKQDDDPMSAAIMAYFKKSDKKGKSNLNLSEILNILDGICERTGQRCIWTTNKSPPQKYFDP